MLGPLISTVGNLVGSFINRESAEDQREATLNWGREQYQHQREFAQNGLTWRIDDAMRNADRVHPIYSLGGGGATYTPTSANFTADNSLGNAVAQSGQDIGRAISATSTQGQKATAFQQAAQTIQLEKGQLENELLKTQLASQQARLRSPATPPFPGSQYLVPGQTQSGPAPDAFKDKVEDRVPSAPGAPQQEGGAIPDVGWARTKDGWAPVPSKNVKERIEDMHLNELMWMYRNNILPTLGMRDPPPNKHLQRDQVWRFDPLRQEYYIKNKPTRHSGW